jgi:RNA-directed DNA polymerase
VRTPEPSGRAEASEKNKGSPGIDGMTVDELPAHLREHWPRLREQLLAGTYQPAQVKQQLIPKANGGMRKLGIPTVVDRFIQQALLQVLQPMFDPDFSQHSHGFRPGHRAHDAIVEAQGTSRADASGWWTWTWSSSSTA